MTTPLPPDEVHVWVVPIDDDTELTPLLGVLDDDERARAARFRSPSAARQYVTVHAAARHIVGRYVGCSPATLRWRHRCHCGGTDHGKPELASPPGIAFSISHTSGCGLVAVTRLARVGVDVERGRPDVEWDTLVERFFAPGEVAHLRGAGGDAARRQWVRREAIGKLHGIGIPPPSMTVALDDDAADDGPRVIDIDAGAGVSAAVAVDGRCGVISTFNWTPTAPVGTEVHGGAQWSRQQHDELR